MTKTTRGRKNPRHWFEGPIHWAFYWLDLYGVDGKPSHHKVLTTVGFFAALYASLRWGLTMESVSEISAEYVALILGVLALPITQGVTKRRNDYSNGNGS